MYHSWHFILYFFALVLFSCAHKYNDSPIIMGKKKSFDNYFKLHTKLKLDPGQYKISSIDFKGDFNRKVLLLDSAQSKLQLFDPMYQDLLLPSHGAKSRSPMTAYHLKGKVVLDFLSFDFTNNGQEELLLLEQNQLSLCKLNLTELKCKKLFAFKQTCLQGHFNLIDLELDRRADILISCQQESKSKNYLLNFEDGSYKDIILSSKLPKDTFFARSYVYDLDKDSLQDLIFLTDNGQVLVYRNLGNTKFRLQDLKIPMQKYNKWDSITFLDIDADLDLDLLLTSQDMIHSQSSWVLLRNDGSYKFEAVEKSWYLKGALASYGALPIDVNLDGNLDIVSSFVELDGLDANASNTKKNYDEKETVSSYYLYQHKKNGGYKSARVMKTKNFYSFEKQFLSKDSKCSPNKSAYMLFDYDNYGKLDYLSIGPSNYLCLFKSNVKNNYVGVKFKASAQNLGRKIYINKGVNNPRNRFSYLYEVSAKNGANQPTPSTFSFHHSVRINPYAKIIISSPLSTDKVISKIRDKQVFVLLD